MINPKKITDFNRSDNQLQEFLLFAIVVAGKQSKIQAQKLDDFLGLITKEFLCDVGYLPQDYFEAIRNAGIETIKSFLRRCRMGQYGRISVAFQNASYLNLRTATLDQLMKVHGIGPKTARFFLLHSRKDAKCAVLDTHILKYIRDCGYDAPKITPPEGKEYRKWEAIFLDLYYPFKERLTLADFDLKIWKKYAQ
jgi:thermostable 8-oxoguanine DNA glycosylase